MSDRLQRLASEFLALSTDEKFPADFEDETENHPTTVRRPEHPTLVPGQYMAQPIEEDDPGKGFQDTEPHPIVGKDGTKRYYRTIWNDVKKRRELQLHRNGGPAVISPDGNHLHFQEGKLHRVDGPAAIFHNGSQNWYLNGDKLSPVEVLQLSLSRGALSPHDVDTLKELGEIAFNEPRSNDRQALEQAGQLLKERGIIESYNRINVTDYMRAAERF